MLPLPLCLALLPAVRGVQSFELADEGTRLVPTEPPRAGDRIHIDYEDACDTSLGREFQFVDVAGPTPPAHGAG